MLNELKKRILVLDGATGTAIQNYKLTETDFRGETFKNHHKNLKGCNEILNITRPDIIQEIHEKYIAAGADIIETNTFNCNRISLKDYAIEEKVFQLVNAGTKIARNTADEHFRKTGKKIFVAGSIGPTSKSLSLPSGDNPYDRELSFDQLKEIYSEQIRGIIEGGADCLLIETIFDGLNAKAALIAAEELFEERGSFLPVMISATVNRQGKLFSGQSIESLITALDREYIISFGLNCSFGAKDLIPLIKKISSFTGKYISLYPNAGLPNEDGEYEETPEITAGYLKELVDNELVNILGGCCGTHFGHIKAIAQLVKNKPARKPDFSDKRRYWLSGNEVYNITKEFTIIGERNNVAGSKIFKTLIEEKNYTKALEISRSQIEKGASVIDVNLDDGLLSSNEEMEKFLRVIQNDPVVSKIPVMIDSSDFKTIETALKNTAGKSIVNSISLKEGEEAFLKKAGTIKKYGAAVVVMAFDEKGQGVSFERKKEICSRSYSLLKSIGYDDYDISFDPNILTIGTGSDDDRYNALSFLKTVQWLKENYPHCSITGGVSNLSFAFRGNTPLRNALHNEFITLAKKLGMNSAIMNPGEKAPSLAPEETDVLLQLIKGEDEALEKVLDLAVKLKSLSAPAKKTVSLDNDIDSLKERIENALIYGGSSTFDKDILNAMQFMQPLEIIQNILMTGMDKIGILFEKGELYLPQLIRSAGVMNKAVDILKPHIKVESNINKKGKILMATVEGDVHDIGKNIAGIVLKCSGYQIIDLGVMVKKERILEEAVKNQVDMITLSGLISPSLKEMEKVLALLTENNISVPVIIAGAATSKLHTAVKLEPLYCQKVLHTTDALDTLTLAGKITGSSADEFLQKKTKELEELRTVYLKQERDVNYENYPKDFFAHETSAPLETGKKYKEIPLSLVEKYINWDFLLHNLKAKNTPVEETTLKDAKDIFEKMKNHRVKVKCSYGIFPCLKNDNSIEIIAANQNWKITFPQVLYKEKYISLADFLNERDYTGAFVISVSSSLFKDDEYLSIVESILLTRIAEAASSYMQYYISRTENWKVDIAPAVGYSSIPDHAVKKYIFEMVDGEKTGAVLTGNYAMSPLSSVCGFYFSNPKSFYFD